MKNDSLGDRMKEYESVPKICLTKRVPVIIRADGKAFHTFCKRFERPYDEVFNDCMNLVMKHLCENIQGAKFAERHSDEISILITDYDKITTDSYFDYGVQKIVSVVAGMATAELCRILSSGEFGRGKEVFMPIDWSGEAWPTFDCRCFNIPESDIDNYFWWRNLDAVRNSINMLAQSKMSHSSLQGKNCNEVQEMLFQDHGINWNDIPQGQKSGFCCFKTKKKKKIEKGPYKGQDFERNIWVVQPSASAKHMLDSQIQYVLHR